MMHVTDFAAAAPIARATRCSLAVPATNLPEAFKGQEAGYRMCAMTGHVCRPAAHCAGLILEARHKGLAGGITAFHGE